MAILNLSCCWTDIDPTTGKVVLKVGTLQNLPLFNGIYRLDEERTNDVNNALIPSEYQPGPVYPERVGGVYFFSNVRFNGSGSGLLEIQLKDHTGANVVNVPVVTFIDLLGRNYTRKIQYLQEKLSLKFGFGLTGVVANVDSRFYLTGIDIFVDEMYEGNLNS